MKTNSQKKKRIEKLSRHRAVMHSSGYFSKIGAQLTKYMLEYGQDMYKQGYEQALEDMENEKCI